MPLYELVLRYDDREEIRLSDRAVSVGETLQIEGRDWQVAWKRAPIGDQATAAFLCELASAKRDGGEMLLDEPKGPTDAATRDAQWHDQ